MLFCGEQIVLDPFSHESLMRTYPYPAFHDNAVVTPDPIAYLEEQGLPLTKIHGDWNQPAYPLQELSALAGVELTSSNDHDFELVPQGINKGRTLAMLALMWGIPLDQCAAVGDSENDLAMLKAVGYPVAMGNGCTSVKAAARHVAPDNAHEGVAHAILWCLDQNQSVWLRRRISLLRSFFLDLPPGGRSILSLSAWLNEILRLSFWDLKGWAV